MCLVQNYSQLFAAIIGVYDLIFPYLLSPSLLARELLLFTASLLGNLF